MRNLLQKMKTEFYENLMYPTYQLKYGNTFGFKIIKILNKLNESQWLSSDELLEYQQKKLRRLIGHAYENVPYYRELMKKMGILPNDIMSVEDIKYLPILTKEQISDNFKDLLSDDIEKRRFIKSSTSGSTGNPLTFIKDWDTIMWIEATTLRGKRWAGYRIGDVDIDFRFLTNPSFLGRVRERIVRRYDFPALAEGAELNNYIRKIKALKPFCITAYASILYRLSKFCYKNGINGLQLPVIFSTGEMLYDYQREFIEKQFGGKVFDYYGCGEVSTIAFECEYHHKHVSDERVILETTDSTGNPVVDALGEVIVTDLDNYAMPFIRYKNGDVGVITKDKCRCGRGLTAVKTIEGRSQEFLKTLDGNYVPPVFFPNSFKNLKGIEQYQIIQEDIYNITLRIVRNQFFTAEELKNMTRVINEKIGNTVTIKIEQCHQIPSKTPTKTRFILSHLPVNLFTVE